MLILLCVIVIVLGLCAFLAVISVIANGKLDK